jgi:hypothetical protein
MALSTPSGAHWGKGRMGPNKQATMPKPDKRLEKKLPFSRAKARNVLKKVNRPANYSFDLTDNDNNRNVSLSPRARPAPTHLPGRVQFCKRRQGAIAQKDEGDKMCQSTGDRVTGTRMQAGARYCPRWVMRF